MKGCSWVPKYLSRTLLYITPKKEVPTHLAQLIRTKKLAHMTCLNICSTLCYNWLLALHLLVFARTVQRIASQFGQVPGSSSHTHPPIHTPPNTPKKMLFPQLMSSPVTLAAWSQLSWPLHCLILSLLPWH